MHATVSHSSHLSRTPSDVSQNTYSLNVASSKISRKETNSAVTTTASSDRASTTSRDGHTSNSADGHERWSGATATTQESQKLLLEESDVRAQEDDYVSLAGGDGSGHRTTSVRDLQASLEGGSSDEEEETVDKNGNRRHYSDDDDVSDDADDDSDQEEKVLSVRRKPRTYQGGGSVELRQLSRASLGNDLSVPLVNASMT